MQGTRLGPYQIDGELGSGGMGKVYAATGPDGVVALKVVHPHLLESPGFFKRFMREAQLGQSIRHENVVRTLDSDQDFTDGKPQCFLVMEYVEGQTLAELLRELERVPEELCRHVAREICKGLAAVHEAGVVHRDLKPENVLITAKHVVKIMDLGVAQVADEALRLSAAGAFVGSAEYAAPEQFKGGEVDGRTDLYALGVLLYELATGTHPCRGGGLHDVLRRVLHDEPRPLGQVNPQVSAFFEEVVHTLLVKDPRGRFASAADLLAVLDAGESSEWWGKRARTLRAQTRRPLRRIRIPRETAVYGRNSELETLRGLFANARSGDGRAVLIEGEAGIGKSRLVDELIARLEAEGEVLNFLFGSYPPGGASSSAGAFSTAFHQQFGADGAAPYLPETPLLVPAFDALLRGDAPPAGAQALNQGSLATCFVHAASALAAERTTVVLIDDLHFASSEARALFTALAMAVPGQRLLLIGTARPGVPEDWRAGLTRLAQTTQVSVPRLGPKDLVRLLEDSLQSRSLAEELGVKIAVKSDGNPFFAFEIIRGLREGQFIRKSSDGTWATTRVIDDLEIPSSVLDLVNARVADLTEQERELLDIAACLGHEFDPTLVGDVLGIARIPLLRTLGQIERQHRLVRASGRSYVFDHHQVQEALYGSLSELLREEYHAALADTLEARHAAAGAEPGTLDGSLCVDLCDHFLRGGRGEAAMRYLTAARDHLRATAAHARALALEERVLAIPGLVSGAARAKFLSLMADVYGPLDMLGHRARQEECAREAERLACELGDTAQAGWAANALGWCLLRAGRFAEGEEAARRALTGACERGDRHQEASVMMTLGLVLRSLGRPEESAQCAERTIVIFGELGNRPQEAGGVINLGAVYLELGRLDDAAEQLERGLAITEELGQRQFAFVAMASLGRVRMAQGRIAEARQLGERCLARSRELGDRNGEVTALGMLGAALLAEGSTAEAGACFERRLALAVATGNPGREAESLGSLADVRWSRGGVAEAVALRGRQIALCRESGIRAGEADGLRGLGLLLRHQGDDAAAESHLQACLAISAETGNQHLQAGAHMELGSLRAARSFAAGGDGEQARTALVAALDLSTAIGRADTEVLARCELARLPGGDPAEALAVYTAAEQRLAPGPRRTALLRLWQLTRDPAHLAEAKRLLDSAAATADETSRAWTLADSGPNRDLLAALREGLGSPAAGSRDDARDDEPRGTESITRAG